MSYSNSSSDACVTGGELDNDLTRLMDCVGIACSECRVDWRSSRELLETCVNVSRGLVKTEKVGGDKSYASKTVSAG